MEHVVLMIAIGAILGLLWSIADKMKANQPDDDQRLGDLQSAYQRQVSRRQLKEQRGEEWTVDDQLDYDEAKTAVRSFHQQQKQKVVDQEEAEKNFIAKRQKVLLWTLGIISALAILGWIDHASRG